VRVGLAPTRWLVGSLCHPLPDQGAELVRSRRGVGFHPGQRREHPWPRETVIPDGITEGLLRRVPHGLDRREPAHQRFPRRAGNPHCRLHRRFRLGGDPPGPVPVRIEMHVGIDPPRQDGVTPQVDGRPTRGCLERGDLPVGNPDPGALDHAAPAIEGMVGQEHDRAGWGCRRRNRGDLCQERGGAERQGAEHLQQRAHRVPGAVGFGRGHIEVLGILPPPCGSRKTDSARGPVISHRMG
jgi:hypothetical protein